MSRPSAIDLQLRIVECVTCARSVDVRQFELGEPDEIAGDLVPTVAQALRCTIQLCSEALLAYESEEVDRDLFDDHAARTSDVFQIDLHALLRREEDERQVADVAFFAVTELRPTLERLEHLPPDVVRWNALADCSSALRRSGNCLTVLERAISRAEGLQPALGFASQLSRSLEVRREYARLRQVIHSKEALVSSEPTVATLVAAMRSVGTAIAILIGRNVYPELRIQDRRELRDLQARILAWLRAEDRDEAHARDGARLWQDLVGFAGLIAQVSRRQELVEHDSLVIGRALEAVRERASRPIADDVLASLGTLTGLDPGLDALLAADVREPSMWAAVLERLGAERGLGAGSSPAGTADTGVAPPKLVG